jgi:hypothetical protein
MRNPVTHWGAYWKFFGREDEPWPVDHWRIGAGSRLAQAEPGDRLWLFTSGQRCRLPEFPGQELGYLVEIMEIGGIEGERTKGRFAFRIRAKQDRHVAVRPGLLVDEYVRPARSDRAAPIGSLWQGARKLSEQAVSGMIEKLRQERPVAFGRFFRNADD